MKMNANSKYDDLAAICNEISIPKRFLYSLTPDYPIFCDKVIEFENSVLDEDESIYSSDVNYNPAIYKIFADLPVSEEELVMLQGSRLLEMFGLADDAIPPPPSALDLKQDEDDDMDDDEDEDFDLEALMREIDDENTTEDFDEPDDEDEEDGEDEEGGEVVGDEEELKPYANDMEYLYAEFQSFKRMVEITEMEESVLFDSDDKKKVAKIKQALKKAKRIAEVRLQKSVKAGFQPRLEAMSRKLKLSEFETNALKVLVVGRAFIEKDSTSYSSNPTVGQLLVLLLQDDLERVKAKKYFLKQAKLLKSNIIQVESSGLEASLTTCDVIIDNRLVEYLIGEDYNVSDYVEGSYLYKSSIHLENVIIPSEDKEKLLTIVDYFPRFLQAKKTIEFSSVVEYGNALVMLFVGPSGTGKTMLANALGNHLDKKLLVVNFNDMSNMNSAFSRTEVNVFSLLFREARMNDSILFFDESEAMLSERYNDLLIEIEKHEGIVIFASNASFKIDEAMRRRINHILHFQEPGPSLRKEIWLEHLPKNLKLHKDVDLNIISQRYEINGGMIKNAVFSALAKAVSEKSSSKPVIKMNHICDGAAEQLKNKLFMSKMEEQKIPQKGIDSVVLPDDTISALREIIDFEKARKVLNGEWGFKDVFPDHNGIAVLLHGPSGTGKTLSAEAIAFESGKNLKFVNYSQLVSKWVGETEKALEVLFKEVADSNSVLLFDEADAIFASRTGVVSSNDRFANIETDVLLGLIERTNTFAILTTNYLENIDPAFFRRIRYVVEFKIPEKSMREKLWSTLLPPKMPVDKDVDLKKLAEKYDFTGGDIKNAIIRAGIKRAVSIDGTRVVTMKDFIQACDNIYTLRNREKGKIGFT
ncbi:MAG: AAA family ATPase [Kiritimatiellaeota bacterium]|nr:AAA family ATPase [Kiritimatiellota bacterium]